MLGPCGTLWGPALDLCETQMGTDLGSTAISGSQSGLILDQCGLGAHVGTIWSKLWANLRDLYMHVHRFPKIQ